MNIVGNAACPSIMYMVAVAAGYRSDKPGTGNSTQSGLRRMNSNIVCRV